MSFPHPPTENAEVYLAQFGRAGGLGAFRLESALSPLRRGQRVLLRTFRGVEVGSLLYPASIRQARILGAICSGALIRPILPTDEARCGQLRTLEAEILQIGRTALLAGRWDFELLDVEILFEGSRAILHHVGPETHLPALIETLSQHYPSWTFLTENLADPTDPADSHDHGCGKPDCGKSEGGCSTCSTGGGCSSCGTGVDLRPYFADLREKMEAPRRTPLL